VKALQQKYFLELQIYIYKKGVSYASCVVSRGQCMCSFLPGEVEFYMPGAQAEIFRRVPEPGSRSLMWGSGGIAPSR